MRQTRFSHEILSQGLTMRFWAGLCQRRNFLCIFLRAVGDLLRGQKLVWHCWAEQAVHSQRAHLRRWAPQWWDVSMFGKAPLNGASLLPSVAPQDGLWGVVLVGSRCVFCVLCCLFFVAGVVFASPPVAGVASVVRSGCIGGWWAWGLRNDRKAWRAGLACTGIGRARGSCFRAPFRLSMH